MALGACLDDQVGVQGEVNVGSLETLELKIFLREGSVTFIRFSKGSAR